MLPKKLSRISAQSLLSGCSSIRAKGSKASSDCTGSPSFHHCDGDSISKAATVSQRLLSVPNWLVIGGLPEDGVDGDRNGKPEIGNGIAKMMLDYCSCHAEALDCIRVAEPT